MRKWFQPEVDFLTRHWNDYTAKEIGEMLKFSESAVSSMASKLGLKKSRDFKFLFWTFVKFKFIIWYYSLITVIILALITPLDRSRLVVVLKNYFKSWYQKQLMQMNRLG